MDPTTAELALISVALARGADPYKFIGKAYEFYQFCDKWEPPPEMPPWVRHEAIGTFLAFLMPKDSPSRRKKMHHGFLVHKNEEAKLAAGELPNELEIERMARDEEEVFKRDGIFGADRILYLRAFSEWRKAHVSSKMSVNAKKMHEKRTAAKRAKQIEQAANREATVKKSRLEYHDPETIDRIAEQEEHPTGKKASKHLHA